MSRVLIVNADDFGATPGVNRGIAEASRDGIVTSASLMVRRPAAREAVELARELPALSLGLHVDLGEWSFDGEGWEATETVVDLEDAFAVAHEVGHQLRLFARLLQRWPTHLDSHQHVHREEPMLGVLSEAARILGVPLRHAGRVRYCGVFHGRGEEGEPLPDLIAEPALVELLRDLPAGVTELCCHPGYARGLVSDYASEREVELRTLCSPGVRDAIVAEGIELRSFGRVPGAERAAQWPLPLP